MAKLKVFKPVANFAQKLWGRLNAAVVRARVERRGAPVVAVTGTNGKTTTVHLIDRMLRGAGHRVGTCTTYGVYHNGVRVAEGDFSGHRGIRRALDCPGLQALVTETGRGGILRYGFGFRRCDVGVVTNVLADHLGLGGVWTLDQMAEVKSRLVRRVAPGGAAVLNADDPRVSAMTRVAPARPIYFSTEGREQEFTYGYFLRDGWLCRKDGAQIERLLPAAEMPMTLGGRAQYNVSNALAALAAVESVRDRLPVPLDVQLAVLRDYERDRRDYPPGRIVLARLDDQYVLLLHCKNPDALRLEAPLIRRIQTALGCRRLVGVLTGVGNRLEEFHLSLSRQVAELSDAVFLRPPLDPFVRGLPAAELTRRLASAFRPDQLLATEPLAAPEMIRLARERQGDSFLLTYFDADLTLDIEEFLRDVPIVSIPESAWS